MYHRLLIIGHLGRDPELRHTPAGSPVTNFSVATNRKWTNVDGTPGEETIWFRVSTWGSQAEACNQYLSKGRLVLVEGRLQVDHATGGPRVWTRNDGTVGASFEVTADVVRFLGGRHDDADDGEPEAKQGELPFETRFNHV